MDSTNLLGELSGWIDFNSQNITAVPTKPGVYIIRMKNGVQFGRLRGRSDIIYIGSTEKGLRGRLRQYLKPDRTQATHQRVNQLMKRYIFEVAWSEDENPKIQEHNLLLQYAGDHNELPPMNRQDVRKLVVKLGEEIPVIDGAANEADRP